MPLPLKLALLQVDETLDLFNELQLQHQAVATKTRTLHDACDRLVCQPISLSMWGNFSYRLCFSLSFCIKFRGTKEQININCMIRGYACS